MSNSPFVNYCKNEECGEAFEPPARVPGECAMAYRIKCLFCYKCREAGAGEE